MRAIMVRMAMSEEDRTVTKITAVVVACSLGAVQLVRALGWIP